MKTLFQPGRQRVPVIAAAVTGLLSLTVPGEAASGAYLKVDGVETWSALESATSEVKAATPNQPAVAPGLTFSKRPDQTSPKLFQAAGRAEKIRRVTLAWRDGAGTVFRVTLEDVLVSSWSTGTDSSTPPQLLETCTLSAGKVEWSWFGTGGAETATGGTGTLLDVPAQQATERTYQPFQAKIERLPNSTRSPGLILTCPVEKGRTYRVSASTKLDGDWVKVDEFTAEADGPVSRSLTGEMTRVFLRVEAVD